LDSPEVGIPRLSIESVTGGYEATRDILQGVDLRIAAGESVGVIGLNGSGKSTGGMRE
jgi:ABC-type multidrug transport system ATPase subunit